MSDLFELTYIDPGVTSFTRSAGGMLRMETDRELFTEITVRRTYPMTRPYEYLSVWTKDDKEIGIIRNIEELDEESREELVTELKLRYIIPAVTRIDSIKEEPGLWTFQVKTDRGDLKLLMRNIHEHIQMIGVNRLIITDMEGKRCEIKDIESLDAASRKHLSKVI
ncbi:DUF1854 domain-containing protein [Bacillus tianshenii]|uniref:DUF1854 domain-containing protein n=1 Tax=Sutcliffiella tianshenii TaxID=1463404 RepID=UPI001CD581EC|nr:DUF1854 domain-containing protein [Bacillus tianshenii]MCA1319661.1 DUF1854 domain-containing protein [Bacillus tianshenii]